MNEMNTEVRKIYETIVEALTFAQYCRWTTDRNGQATPSDYKSRLSTVGRVTKSKALIQLSHDGLNLLNKYEV